MTATTIDLLRHGEPVGGIRYRGCGLDDPLSEKGWQQMLHAVEDAGPWTRLISSPMQRCLPFAEMLAAKLGIPLHVDPRLKEIHFGAWEGKSLRDLLETDGDAYHRFLKDPVNERPAGAEPLTSFYARVTKAVHEHAVNYPGEHLLLIVHAGVMRSVISEALRAPLHTLYRIRVGSAAVARLRYFHDRDHTEFVSLGPGH